AKLGESDEVVRFFNKVYVNDYWKRFGFLADWRRFATTVSPGYMKFIQWQFLTLHEKGLLVQKPYYATFCPVDGPVAVDASETDISKGGGAEKNEYTLLKFHIDMAMERPTYILAATLRPETVYGQTNFWADPELEYVVITDGKENWILSHQAAEKLKHQIDGLEETGRIEGAELIGKWCLAPGVEREIPILPSRFCDPDVGTGLVTSVPSDAPVDWIALRDIQRDKNLCEQLGLNQEQINGIQPISIIKSKGYGPMPAVEICERMGIESQDDVEKLEEAKKEVYKIGFHTGVMMDNAGPYAGMRVEEAKEAMKQDMLASGKAIVMHDLSEEVVCRCGERVVIKRIDDQWFIRYSDADLTEKSTGHARNMNIRPKEFYENLPNVLEWFQDRACVRMGSWLGTRFPLDEKWIIEPISDSTLYPIYYLVSKYVNDGELKEENLTKEFFDYVYLERGSPEEASASTGVEKELLLRIRRDVEYWYPLDINLGGKEHMTVHFPVFLMNHVAIMPENMRPQGIFSHWYIVGKGSKISKSKGGAEPIPDAMGHFGVDAMRLFYCNSGSPFVDVEWDEELVGNYKNRLEKVFALVEQLEDVKGVEGLLDGWLESKLEACASAVEEGMDNFDLRKATNAIYFDLPADIRWYLKRGGENGELLRRGSLRIALMMTPFTPHMAEELWERLGGEELASNNMLPEARKQDGTALAVEDFLISTMADISQILKVTKIEPKRIALYTSPEWKHQILRIIVETGETNPGPIIKKIMDEKPEMRSMGKEISQYVASMAKEARKMGDQVLEAMLADVDECEYLRRSKPFLEAEYGCKVDVFSAEEANKESDPANKARFAIPRRPAIYVE
ncbi:MAG: leucine--tRNA ligase, partial [Candidatus Thermoplasmatota archaeon]|nr:leucine--tRNA ligase [Candidatus Thermoplasmatota archaeon]